jgi:hypothetical protein
MSHLKVQRSYIATFINTLVLGCLRIENHNQIDHILIDRRRHSSVLDIRPFRAANCDTDYDINLLGDNIDTINKNIETLIDVSKEVGLETNER